MTASRTAPASGGVEVAAAPGAAGLLTVAEVPGATRAEAAATALRRAISLGGFAPGEKLNEVDVAERLGVSRNTLREAFAMLGAEGVVAREPYRGVFLATPTTADVEDLYRVRATVEPACVLWAPGLAEADTLPCVEELVSVTARARRLLEAGDLAEVAVCNQRFHRSIVASVDAPSLVAFSDRMLARMRLLFLLVTRFEPEFHADYVTPNAKVAALLAAGERTAAAEELRASLLATSSRIAGILDSNKY